MKEILKKTIPYLVALVIFLGLSAILDAPEIFEGLADRKSVV